MGIAPNYLPPSLEKQAADEQLMQLTLVRSASSIVLGLIGIYLASRFWGKGFWRGFGGYVVGANVGFLIAYAATRNSWNDAVSKGGVKPL
jgi:hypothetical protein